jgi:hypothetical protein
MKPEPPLQEQSLEKLGLVSAVGRCRPIVALVFRIAAQEFPGKLPRIEIVQKGIGGRRPPVGYWRHLKLHNFALQV